MSPSTSNRLQPLIHVVFSSAPAIPLYGLCWGSLNIAIDMVWRTGRWNKYGTRDGDDRKGGVEVEAGERVKSQRVCQAMFGCHFSNPSSTSLFVIDLSLLGTFFR